MILVWYAQERQRESEIVYENGSLHRKSSVEALRWSSVASWELCPIEKAIRVGYCVRVSQIKMRQNESRCSICSAVTPNRSKIEKDKNVCEHYVRHKIGDHHVHGRRRPSIQNIVASWWCYLLISVPLYSKLHHQPPFCIITNQPYCNPSSLTKHDNCLLLLWLLLLLLLGIINISVAKLMRKCCWIAVISFHFDLFSFMYGKLLKKFLLNRINQCIFTCCSTFSLFACN